MSPYADDDSGEAVRDLFMRPFELLGFREVTPQPWFQTTSTGGRLVALGRRHSDND